MGKELFQLLLKYMKGQRIENIYLFTDTSCNYGFYEHQGMIQRGAIEQNFVIHNQRADMTFFLYDLQCFVPKYNMKMEIEIFLDSIRHSFYNRYRCFNTCVSER